MIHHRLLFRHRERRFVIRLGNRLAIAGMGFLSVGLAAILGLIARIVFGDVMATCVGAIGGVLLGTLWFAVPVTRRLHV